MFTMLVHVSFEEVKSFIPRVPQERAKGENKTVKRICFSEGIEKAMNAIPLGGYALRGMLKSKRVTPILHVYFCIVSDNPDVRFVPPETVQMKYHVLDAESMREWWALDIPKLEHRLVRVDKANMADYTDQFGNHGVCIKNLEHDLVKKLPANAPELWIRGTSLEDYGVRTVFACLGQKQMDKE